MSQASDHHPARLQTEYGRFWVYPVVGFFDVVTYELLPFTRFSLKVIDQRNGEFLAVPNVHVRNSSTNCIEYTCGLGETVEESVQDAIKMIILEAKKQLLNKPNGELEDADFVWFNLHTYVGPGTSEDGLQGPMAN